MNITLYSKSNCPNCVAAKMQLQARGLEYTEISLDDEARKANFLAAYPEVKQMPQVFIGDQRVGGLAGLRAALEQLDKKESA
jgi:glutaredoxin 3